MLLFQLICCSLAASTFAAPNSTEKPSTPDQYSDPKTITKKSRNQKENNFEHTQTLPFPLRGKALEKDYGDFEKKIIRRSAPAPAGAIRLDVKKLLEKYKDELITSTTAKAVVTKPSSRRGRAKSNQNRTRVKKDVTTVSPVLTTSQINPKVVDDDITLETSASGRKRSRIQVKKAPNGQEYEYEYVYYYYDEDEDTSKKEETPREDITNGHDGPAKDEEPVVKEKIQEANEIVPLSTRSRGRQIANLGEDVIGDDRLPANTRFPPRSRNLNTTPLNENIKEETSTTSRPPRIRRPPQQPVDSPETDNITDETQGSRGRTRANVKRPSLELVDSDTFNTNFNAGGPNQVDPQGGPSFPVDLPAGPVRFLGVTPNESVNLPASTQENKSSVPQNSEKEKEVVVTEDATAATDPMDKVALELYAISQGNQKLFGEDSKSQDDKTVDEVTTEEAAITTTTTSTTTPAPTTKTTTTTPAPVTTTTVQSTEGTLFGRNRFRGRVGSSRKTTTESSEVETSTKAKKFGGNRHSFGNHRSRATVKTTEHSEDEEKATKENAKPVSQGRPSTRPRFGSNGRTRSRTTATPSEETRESNNISPSTTATRSPRPRPNFNLRGRTRPTPTSTTSEGTIIQTNEESDTSSDQTPSTTAKSRRIQTGTHSSVRPLRPGPRINLANRRIGQVTSSTSTEISIKDEVKEQPINEETKDETSESTPITTNSINRLKNRNRVQVGTAVRPKVAASSPVQVRRINPLLARKRPNQKAEVTSEATAETQPTEGFTAAEEQQPSETVSTSSTTEEPRGLSKLLAGRKKLAVQHKN